MGRGAVGRMAGARLLVCAVLFGLFLMHGSPASAAGGCHGAMAMGSLTATGHPGSAPEAGVHDAGPAAPGEAGTGTAGGTCVSTPAHEQVAPAAPGLLAVGAVTVLTAGTRARPQAGAGSRRRGSPANGRDRLIEVCVART